MTTYSTNEFKTGLKLMIDGDPYSVLENEFVKPGKGQAFNRVKLRNLKNGRVLERTYKSGETVEGADVLDLELQYLYSDGEMWYFMHPTSYEQYVADAKAVEDAAQWIKGEEMCIVTLKITETDPGVRGDTATGGTKPATLETGAVVKVPLFVEQGEVIRVDTRTASYMSRAKE